MASEHLNPYASPVGVPTDRLADDGAVGTLTVKLLEGTRPWVKLLAVLGMIGMAFITLGLVGLIIAAVQDVNFGPGAMKPLPMAVMYAVMLGLYGYPVMCLSRYGSRIRDFSQVGGVDSLNAALNEQRKFWKFVGIITVLSIVLYIVGVVLLIVAVAYFGPDAIKPIVEPPGQPMPVQPN